MKEHSEGYEAIRDEDGKLIEERWHEEDSELDNPLLAMVLGKATKGQTASFILQNQPPTEPSAPTARSSSESRVGAPDGGGGQA